MRCPGRRTAGGTARFAGLPVAALFAALFISLTAGVGLCAFAAPPAPPSAGQAATPSWKAAYAGARSLRAERYYARSYGVDELQVRSTASGSSLEFRYRVLDVQKAAVLNDKRVKPVMIDQKSGTRLSVPTMEKIGALRQTAPPEEGHEYWMVFANPGKLVKPGERVDVVIGAFRATSLTVQ
jgi:hypothetical protein